MKLLIIAFNCKKDNINIYKHEQSLYLFSFPIKKIKKCRYSEFINNNESEKEIINIIYKYKNHYDFILLLNNKNKINIDFNNLFNFDNQNFNNNFIFIGTKTPSKFDFDKKILIGSRYILDQLFISCKNLKNNYKEDLVERTIKDIYFPYFSKIIYSKNSFCYSGKSNGIVKNRDNIIF